MKMDVDEEFVSLWHSIRVDQLGEQGVEECLRSMGLPVMQSAEPVEEQKEAVEAVPSKKKRRGRTAKTQNVHLDGVLKEYELE